MKLRVKPRIKLRVKKRLVLRVKPKTRFKLRLVYRCKTVEELSEELGSSLSPKACRIERKRAEKPLPKSSGARKCADCGVRCRDVKKGWSEDWAPLETLPALCRTCEVARFFATRKEAEKDEQRREAFIKGAGPHWEGGGSVFTGHARHKKKRMKLRLVKKKLKLRVRR